MKFAPSLIISLSLSITLGAHILAEPAPTSAPAEKRPPRPRNEFAFSILPRSFQTKPALDLVGMTEMTAEGKKIPAPSPENPIYYIAHDSGFKVEGDAAQNAPKINPERFQRLFTSALKSAGYNAADDTHPPSQALFFVWGVHAKLDKLEDGSYPPGFYENAIIRASLVGGVKFAQEFTKALVEQNDLGADLGMMNPLYRFTNRDDLTRELVEQVWDDIYFVVVSSYDAAALARKERKLLWRTKLTTSSNGLSLEETLPALVTSGGTLFGKDIPVAEIYTKRIDRKGSVTVGEAKVQDYLDEKPAPSTPPAPTPQPTPAK